MAEIREPKKVSSILKKRKIIEAGLKVFCERGFHKTTTVDIAHAAGVSTGIVYSYFIDKKDIFFQCLSLYLEKLYLPVLDHVNELTPANIEQSLRVIIKTTLQSHLDNQSSHILMNSMSTTYSEVNEMFLKAEQDLTNALAKTLLKNGFNKEYIHEKAHIAFNLVENLCHECAYHKHDNTNNETLIELYLKLIIALFQ